MYLCSHLVVVVNRYILLFTTTTGFTVWRCRGGYTSREGNTGVDALLLGLGWGVRCFDVGSRSLLVAGEGVICREGESWNWTY